MIFIENLDHNPQAVTLEKLPDGTAWLYLRKDAHEVRTEAPEGEQGGTSWECTTALCKLGSDYERYEYCYRLYRDSDYGSSVRRGDSLRL